MSEAESQVGDGHRVHRQSPPPTGSPNAEAGPSEPQSRGPAAPIEALSTDELSSLIASKRHHRPHKTLFRKHRQAGGHAAEEAMDGTEEGPIMDDMISERWIREDARRREEEAVAANEGRTSLKLKKGDREWDFAYGEGDGQEDGDHLHGATPGAEDGYVWDVLFENQRGIYIFGKPHFSSNSLLPLDPSAFTVPLTPPKTSDITMSRSSSRSSKPRSKARPRQPGADASQEPRKKTDQTPLRKTINTAYTPETYQLPSPEWTWVTPWLVNMRDGTDEAGWRYNAWFRRTKWKSHAGPAGWAGWVRRREWVRLRQAVAYETDPPQNDTSPKKNGPAMLRFDPRAVFRGEEDPELELDRLVRAMSRPHLDRERLDAWKDWLDQAAQQQKEALTEVLSSDGVEYNLRSSFIYGSSYEALLALLRGQKILSEPEKPPSPGPSKAIPQECYLHDHSPADSLTKPYDV